MLARISVSCTKICVRVSVDMVSEMASDSCFRECMHFLGYDHTPDDSHRRFWREVYCVQ